MSTTTKKANSIVPANNNAQNQVQFDISIFEIDKEKGMVNLTKIADYFGKEVFEWKRLPSTKKFLKAFFVKNPERENLVVINGGVSANGTWASRKLALKFAEWISVDFEIYANEVMDTLFQTGKVELAPTQTANQFDFFRGLIDTLETQNSRISNVENKLEKVIEIKQNILEIVGEAPQKTARMSLRQLVEDYCDSHKEEYNIYQFTWGRIYREVKDRLSVDVKARAKEYNKALEKAGGKKKDQKRPIDFIEELGLEKPTIAIFLEITAEKVE